MRKAIIKVVTPEGPTFKIINELALDEIREFCRKTGYNYKIIGTRKENKKSILKVS